MKKTNANALPDDVEALKKMVLDLQNQQQADAERLQQESEQWKRKFYHLLEEWQLELKKRFAASSEGLRVRATCSTRLKTSSNLTSKRLLPSSTLLTPVNYRAVSA